jgi:hypothetical protein
MSKKASLLDFDRNLVEEFGLPVKYELSQEDKKAFVMEQADQIAKVLWRCRVELMAIELVTAETPEQKLSKAQEQQKLRGELKQYSAAVNSFLTIAEAL